MKINVDRIAHMNYSWAKHWMKIERNQYFSTHDSYGDERIHKKLHLIMLEISSSHKQSKTKFLCCITKTVTVMIQF